MRLTERVRPNALPESVSNKTKLTVVNAVDVFVSLLGDLVVHRFREFVRRC